MRRCVLHIGWHKTGTTALQHFLHAHLDRLATHTVHVPAFSANHSAFLPSVFVGDGSATYNETFVLPLTGHEAVDKRSASHLVADEVLVAQDDGTMVLSAEDLCLLDRSAIQRCHDRLTTIFEQVEIVAYVRNHGAYAHSACQQLLRMGFGIDDIVAMAQDGTAPIFVLEPLPHYGRRLGDWADIFGAESVRVFSYDDLRARDRSVLEHFLEDVLKLDDLALTGAAAAHPRVNSSFSATAAYLLNRMNARVPLFVDGEPNPGFQFNRQRHLATIDGPDATAPDELWQPVVEAYVTDVRELVERLGPAAP